MSRGAGRALLGWDHRRPQRHARPGFAGGGARAAGPDRSRHRTQHIHPRGRAHQRAPGQADADAERAPWAVAAGFGLLHGLGFAGALAEVGLPAAEIPLALFSFNVGIELGQLAFVGVVLLVAAALRKVPVAWPRWAQAVPAYGIGTMATFWFLQRAVSLL